MLKQGASLFFEVKLLKDKRVRLSLLHVEHSGNKHTFLPAFGSGGKEERITSRPSFFLKSMKGKGKADDKQTILSFCIWCRKKGWADNKQTILSYCIACRKKGRAYNKKIHNTQTLTNLSRKVGLIAETYLECFWQPSFQESCCYFLNELLFL